MNKSVVIRTAAAVLMGGVLLLGIAGCARPKKPTTDEPETTGATGKENTADCTLVFDSFDGGGPSYSVTIEDESVVSYTSEQRYRNPNHDQMDGSAFDVILSFKGLKPGSTSVTVVGESPIMPAETWRYTAAVDETLHVTLTQEESPDMPEAIQPVPTLVLHTQQMTVYPSLADTSAADDLTSFLSSEPLELKLQADETGYTGALPWILPPDGEEIDVQPGDILLRDVNELVLCAAPQTGAFTRLATLDGDALDRLLPSLENGGTVSLWVEWSE